VPFVDVSDRSSTRILFAGACLVVVVAGLNAAEPVFLPLLMAVFLAILCVPPLAWLRRRGLPRWLATALVAIGASLALLAVAVIIGGTLQQFYDRVPYYQTRLDELVGSGIEALRRRGVEVSPGGLTGELNAGRLLDLLASTASGVVSALSSVLLVLLLTGFLLVELTIAPNKLRAALGDPDADLGGAVRGAEQVQRYLGVKTLMSLLNAAIAVGICLVFGIDFALLWGLLAFLFNFVPNVGSILAGAPPVLLALIQHGPLRALVVAGLYILLDFLSSNLLEPRLMGRRLGLSPLVVMLSLVFWGWLWGPVGMLLSVPLTAVLKLLLEQSRDLRWVAILLGTGEEPPDGRAPRPAAPEGDAGG